MLQQPTCYINRHVTTADILHQSTCYNRRHVTEADMLQQTTCYNNKFWRKKTVDFSLITKGLSKKSKKQNMYKARYINAYRHIDMAFKQSKKTMNSLNIKKAMIFMVALSHCAHWDYV